MQELVIDNIHHIGHVDKNRFLKIYNFIKDRKTFDENNNDISSFKYFYYDDNFHWGFSINNTHRNNIIYGCNVYNYYNYALSSLCSLFSCNASLSSISLSSLLLPTTSLPLLKVTHQKTFPRM